MEIQLAMVVLEVRDLDASIAFYRRLGLEVPDRSMVGRSPRIGWEAESVCF